MLKNGAIRVYRLVEGCVAGAGGGVYFLLITTGFTGHPGPLHPQSELGPVDELRP
jgi:hypothetical protein